MLEKAGAGVCACVSWSSLTACPLFFHAAARRGTAILLRGDAVLCFLAADGHFAFPTFRMYGRDEKIGTMNRDNLTPELETGACAG